MMEDRAVGGWLTLAVLGALVPWQSTTTSPLCVSGNFCGSIPRFSGFEGGALPAGTSSVAFWGWVVFLVVAVLGLAIFQINRLYPGARIPLQHRIGPRFYQGAGAILLLSAVPATGLSSSQTAPIPNGGGSSFVTFTTGPDPWIVVAVIAAVALCRGGYLFRGNWRESRYLKQLLFDPTLS
jgi:hypothetical protein